MTEGGTRRPRDRRPVQTEIAGLGPVLLMADTTGVWGSTALGIRRLWTGRLIPGSLAVTPRLAFGSSSQTPEKSIGAGRAFRAAGVRLATPDFGEGEGAAVCAQIDAATKSAAAAASRPEGLTRGPSRARLREIAGETARCRSS